MSRCTCDDNRKPRCPDCDRRASEWRCDAFLRAQYGVQNVSRGKGRAWARINGRTVTVRVDTDTDRVVEVA